MSMVLDETDVIETLWPVYGPAKRAPMVEHFRSHLCTVEILRRDTIEPVVFCRPKLFVASYAQLRRQHDIKVLDVCPRDDGTVKLQTWQEKALEKCHEVELKSFGFIIL
jgi:hypothetical protein